MSATIYEQGPNEVVPYGVRVTGDTVVSATWTITAGGTVSGPSITSTTATAFASGLTLGVTYDLSAHIVMRSGQQRDQCFTILCVDLCA